MHTALPIWFMADLSQETRDYGSQLARRPRPAVIQADWQNRYGPQNRRDYRAAASFFAEDPAQCRRESYRTPPVAAARLPVGWATVIIQ
jgi:hypothetical protein